MTRTFKTFGAFGNALEAAARDLNSEQKRRITREMAERAQQIATAAASADLGGDPKFSGWAPRLDTQIKTLRDGASLLIPTRSSAGPWTVAQRGRNQGNAGGFQGPGVNRRSGLTARTRSGGLRRVRTATARSKWNGYTRGKNTAAEAVAQMEKELPKIAEAGVIKAIQKHVDVD